MAPTSPTPGDRDLATGDIEILLGAFAVLGCDRLSAGKLHADSGRVRYNKTISTVSGGWRRIYAKRTNFGILNEINAVRFPCRDDHRRLCVIAPATRLALSGCVPRQ